MLLGIVVTIGIAILGGLIVGLLLKLGNRKNTAEIMFNDHVTFYKVPRSN